VHGHWSEGRLAERVQARGHSLARNGYVCLNVDAFGAGERSTTPRPLRVPRRAPGGAILDVGETLMGMQIVDNMRGVSLLRSLPFVLGDRIGVTGASGGGNQTMWVAAMDDRIAAAVPVVKRGDVRSLRRRHQLHLRDAPGAVPLTETAGILALVAPRALKICNALRDANPSVWYTGPRRRERAEHFRRINVGLRP